MLKKSEITKKIQLEKKHLPISDIKPQNIYSLYHIHKHHIKQNSDHGSYFDTHSNRTRYWKTLSFVVNFAGISLTTTRKDSWFERIGGIHYFHEQIDSIEFIQGGKKNTIKTYNLGPLLSLLNKNVNNKWVQIMFNNVKQMHAQTRN